MHSPIIRKGMSISPDHHRYTTTGFHHYVRDIEITRLGPDFIVKYISYCILPPPLAELLSHSDQNNTKLSLYHNYNACPKRDNI